MHYCTSVQFCNCLLTSIFQHQTPYTHQIDNPASVQQQQQPIQSSTPLCGEKRRRLEVFCVLCVFRKFVCPPAKTRYQGTLLITTPHLHKPQTPPTVLSRCRAENRRTSSTLSSLHNNRLSPDQHHHHHSIIESVGPYVKSAHAATGAKKTTKPKTCRCRATESSSCAVIVRSLHRRLSSVSVACRVVNHRVCVCVSA